MTRVCGRDGTGSLERETMTRVCGRDGTGSLEREEIERLDDPENVDALLALLDENNDGEVSMDESVTGRRTRAPCTQTA